MINLSIILSRFNIISPLMISTQTILSNCFQTIMRIIIIKNHSKI